MNQKVLIEGARILKGKDAEDADLGPLAQLRGKWESAPNPPGGIAQGWNVISVPGPSGFVFEVIPYKETLTFEPVIIALNKGPFIEGNQTVQQITGLMYEQNIFSECPYQIDDINKPTPCSKFKKGDQIHAETGFLLNFKQKADPNNPSGGFDFARLSTIPHGNSVLALGHAEHSVNPPTLVFPQVSSAPTRIDGSSAGVGYFDPLPPGEQQFPFVFNEDWPNSFLKKALGNQKITELTTLQMSTNNINAGGGILNIPFIEANAKATSMDAIFWIEKIDGIDTLQLQYSQTINLVFPPTGSSRPIVWPHITINTLTKQG